MKVFLICSKRFYAKLPPIVTELERAGHVLTMPNSYENPEDEDHYRTLGVSEHSKWKAEKINHSKAVVRETDAVLVLNFEKEGVPNYIGGATFLEMYDAFCLNKKIFLYNPVPTGILFDEIMGFEPTVVYGDLSRVN